MRRICRLAVLLVAVLFVFPLTSLAQNIHEAVSVEERQVAGDSHRKYFLIRHKQPSAKTGKRGLLLILPGGPGSADFLPFCANVLTRFGVPESFLVAELVAPVWREDENRIVWPSKAFPDEKAKFTTEEFISAVITDVSKQHEIDDRFIFTLGWSSSGHVLYSASVSSPKIRGSIVAMSRFFPGRMLKLKDVRGKNYFLYHSPDDKVYPYRDAELAEKSLREHGANVKLVTYKGGHGWIPHTYYCDKIKEGIRWLIRVNSKPPAVEGPHTNAKELQ